MHARKIKFYTKYTKLVHSFLENFSTWQLSYKAEVKTHIAIRAGSFLCHAVNRPSLVDTMISMWILWSLWERIGSDFSPGWTLRHPWSPPWPWRPPSSPSLSGSFAPPRSLSGACCCCRRRSICWAKENVRLFSLVWFSTRTKVAFWSGSLARNSKPLNDTSEHHDIGIKKNLSTSSLYTSKI